jgi:ribosomal protein S27E
MNQPINEMFKQPLWRLLIIPIALIGLCIIYVVGGAGILRLIGILCLIASCVLLEKRAIFSKLHPTQAVQSVAAVKAKKQPAFIKAMCPNCKQHIEVDGGWAGSEVLCPTCQTAFIVKPTLVVLSTQPPPLPASTIAPMDKEHLANYYIAQNNEKRGPYTINQLRSLWNAGSLTAETLYCQKGFPEWIPLARIISDLEPSQPSPALPPSPSLVGQKQPTIPAVGRFKITKKHIITLAPFALVMLLCIIVIPEIINHTTTSPSISTSVPASSGQEKKGTRGLFTPNEFLNWFGGEPKSLVKDSLGPPDSVSGDDWLYTDIIYNKDSEKTNDVWIEFEQRGIDPNVKTVAGIRVSGMRYYIPRDKNFGL